MNDCPTCGHDAVRVSPHSAPDVGIIADGTVHHHDGVAYVHAPGVVDDADDAPNDNYYIHLSPQS